MARKKPEKAWKPRSPDITRVTTSFVEDALKYVKANCGCCYKWLDRWFKDEKGRERPFAVVFSQSDVDGEYRCKVAYNTDDLQCDYEWDWYMPFAIESGDVYDTELSGAIDGADAKELADALNRMAAEVVTWYAE